MWYNPLQVHDGCKEYVKMRTKVFVAGDLMLDRFEYGKVSRISPEAPVPIFRHEREKRMLGGVGNVAANLIALGCDVTLAGAVGTDASGEEVLRLVNELGARGVIARSRSFRTVVKTRMIAGNNHLLRADLEDESPSLAIAAATLARMERAIAAADVVLLSDYAKGFLSPELCARLIGVARQRRKPVLIDPKGVDWEKYRGATLVKPNLREFSQICGRTFDPRSAGFKTTLEAEARRICAKFGIRNVLVTLSEHGMILVPASSRLAAIHIPTEAREVFDVSGAGDTALAAFGWAVGSGRSLPEAMRMANVASGIVVSKLGTATVSRRELELALGGGDDPFAALEGKIVSVRSAAAFAGECRAKGKRIGFTNGCFDCLHLGHLYSILETKRRCDAVIVGLNSDRSVRRHKGPSRPIQDERTRAMVLAALPQVDRVVIFDDDVPMKLVESVRPDVIAKEGYPLSKWPEGRLVRRLGGKAVVLKRLDGHSTTALVRRMRDEK